jgi:hypothetical protein
MGRAGDKAVRRRAIRSGRIPIAPTEHFGAWGVVPPDDCSGVIRTKALPATTACIMDALLSFLA